MIGQIVRRDLADSKKQLIWIITSVILYVLAYDKVPDDYRDIGFLGLIWIPSVALLSLTITNPQFGQSLSLNYFRLACQSRQKAFVSLYVRSLVLLSPFFLSAGLVELLSLSRGHLTVFHKLLGRPTALQETLLALELYSLAGVGLLWAGIRSSDLNIRIGQGAKLNLQTAQDSLSGIGLFGVAFLVPYTFSENPWVTVTALFLWLGLEFYSAYKMWTFQPGWVNALSRLLKQLAGLLFAVLIALILTGNISVFSFLKSKFMQLEVKKVTASRTFGPVVLEPGDEITYLKGEAVTLTFKRDYEFKGSSLPPDTEFVIGSKPLRFILNRDHSLLNTFLPKGSEVLFLYDPNMIELRISSYVPGPFKLDGVTALYFEDAVLFRAVNKKKQVIGDRVYPKGVVLEFDQFRQITKIEDRK